MSIAKVEPITTARALRGPFDYRLPAEMADLGVGSVVKVPFGRRRLLGVVVELAESSELAPERLAEPIEAMQTGVPAELVRLGLWVAREYCSTPSRGLRLVMPPGAGVRKPRPRARPEHPVGQGGGRRSPELVPEQARAVAAIAAALERQRAPRESLLLHGVTGSGKTEVYLAAVEAALALGRGAIVLVPEIGLTPQAVSRFRARLGERFAVLHSALTEAERAAEWRRLASGEASVCIGARSAVFAPVRELGLIVIDEEHDPSYKQDSDPSYDARAVAARRAEQCGAVLVCGTATPRPESWLALPRLELPRRVDGRALPGVAVLDMRSADPRSGPLHAESWAALERVRAAGSKAIVMINRRGFSPWLSCRGCGHHWGCPNCDVSMIVHRGSRRLVCHHCAHAEPLALSCPECGSSTLSRAGAGTERIEALLRERLDPQPVFRLDSDTAAPRGAHAEILGRFAEAKSAVLVGTQIVAKGHDFPEVTLSAILDADATLRFPDFRAEERTFAMVAQLAGRSGRGAAGGEVIVQTIAPGAASIEHAARHDAAGFLAGELARREALRYPPFSHLARIGLAAESEGRLAEVCERLGPALGDSLPAGSELLGPAPMFRVRNRHRRRFLIKASDRGATIAAIGSVIERLGSDRSLRGVAVGVDIDPQ